MLQSVMHNRFFKLPFQFDQSRLLHDLSVCVNGHWQKHFNQADYSGEWTSIALRSSSGSETDILAHPGAAAFKDTSLLKDCAYFTEVLSSFQCVLESVRLLSLAPGSEIKEHSDPHTAYEYGVFRLHVPVQNGGRVSFLVDGCGLDMKPGECWYASFHLPHSVKNNGDARRIHLVIDGQRNAWTDKVFAEAGYDFEAERRQVDYNRGTKQQMIAELMRMDTDAARQLAAQLTNELHSHPA